MFRISSFALLTAAATISSAAQAAESRRSGCTDATLTGPYAFTASGFTLPSSKLPAALTGPFASFGTATYDGAGNVVLSASASFNGNPQTLANVKGTYRVAGDCTFTSMLENGVHFFAVITGGGDELLVQQTTPGTVVSGTAERIGRAKSEGERPNRCDAATIAGTYGFIATGYGAPPDVKPELAGPQSGVGTVSFDGRGRFTVREVGSTNGNVNTEPVEFTGGYTLSPACALGMTFDAGLTFTGLVTDRGRRMQVVETDRGATVLVRTRSLN